HHAAQLVPDAVPGGLAGPLPRPQGGGGAGGVVDEHKYDPGHHHPAEPPPQGGEGGAYGGYRRLEGIDVLHVRLLSRAAAPAGPAPRRPPGGSTYLWDGYRQIHPQRKPCSRLPWPSRPAHWAGRSPDPAP